jgi:putative transcriptional regulator
MVKCHLSRMLGERKLKISDVSRETGIHRNMLTLLYYEKAKRIEFDVLEKLCLFFKCQVGELFELQPEAK